METGDFKYGYEKYIYTPTNYVNDYVNTWKVNATVYRE